MANLAALVGENCTVDQKLSKNTKILLIDCASQMLTLAVESWIDAKPELCNSIDTVQKVAVELRTVKNSAKRNELTLLAATGPFETRWSEKFEMLRRFFRNEEHIRQIEKVENDMLSTFQLRRLKSTMKDF